MKTIKNAFASLLATLVLALGLTNIAAACDAGNQCINNVGTYNGVEMGGTLNGGALANGLANGIGQTTYSETFSKAEWTGLSVVDLTATAGAADCLNCTDNLAKFQFNGKALSAAGALNQTTTNGGPAQSDAKATGTSGFNGQGFSYVLKPLTY